MAINKKVIGLSLAAVILVGGAYGNYAIDKKAEDSIKKELTNIGSFSKVNCNVLLQNTCNIYDLKDAMGMIKVKEIMVKGVRDLATISDAKDILNLKGKYQIETHIKGLSGQNGGGVLNAQMLGSELRDVSAILGKKNMNALTTQPCNIDIKTNLDANLKNWKTTSSVAYSVDNFPLKIEMGITNTASASIMNKIKTNASELNSDAAIANLMTLVLNNAYIKLSQKDGFFADILQNFYTEQARQSGISKPKEWKQYNKMLIGGMLPGVKTPLSSKSSVITNDEAKDILADAITNDKSALKKTLLETVQVKDSELKKIAEEMVKNDRGEITVKVTNKNKFSVEDLLGLNPAHRVNANHLKDNFKIEVL